jgi:FkbM family methyltransferase
MVAYSTDFSYQGHSFHFNLLPKCSVSQHLDTKGAFYELPFLEALGEILPSETVAFDVGAHIGNHTVYFAKVLGWRVVAFEPNPEAFEKLVANVEANEVGELVTCFQVALTDSPGTVQMARTEPSDAGTVAIVDAGKRLESIIEVEAGLLDSYEQFAGEGPTLLKLDVEGHERTVIEGGKRFLGRVAPYVTTEVQSVSAFDDLLGVLGDSYRPSGVFNPTPTIVWVPIHERGPLSSDLDVIRYAVRAQISYNEAQTRTRRTLQIVESALDREKADRPTENELADIVRLRDQLSAAAEIQRLTRRRLLIVVVGECHVPAPALSAIAKAVDLVEISDTETRTVSMRRYVSGRLTKERVATSHLRSDHLTAAQIVLFVETGDRRLGHVDAAAVVGGESAPDLADVAIDLLGAPYINVTLDPVYLASHLRLLVGSSACFVRSHDLLDAWQARQIMPADVLDPEDPISMAGGMSRALPKAPSKRRERDKTDRRLLLVSYYSPPATSVAMQRLMYWKDNLGSIASETGISLSVDWLSATNGSPSGEGFVFVADRGPFLLPAAEWEKVKELDDLDLDVIGATWSHHVRQSIDRLQGSYDTVLISGNPFYYFDLAPFFREHWGSRVILDFRDPWARNERFKYSTRQRAKLMKLEEELVSNADSVISVNQACLDAIAPTVRVPRYVVANGFDESIVNAVRRPDSEASKHDGRTHLVYAGTIYRSFPLDNLLDSLATDRYQLVHYGRDYSSSQAVKVHPVARAAGPISYENLISELKSSDAGVITTMGEPTMSTTKLFDYVACELDIIIITKGKPRTGLLHELTLNLDGVYWVEDDPAELKSFFESYRPERRPRRESLRFSRREQARRLLEIVNDQQLAVL